MALCWEWSRRSERNKLAGSRQARRERSSARRRSKSSGSRDLDCRCAAFHRFETHWEEFVLSNLPAHRVGAI
jgi:hypothetical protein